MHFFPICGEFERVSLEGFAIARNKILDSCHWLPLTRFTRRFTRITAIRMPPVLDWWLWIFARIFATIGKLPAILPNSQNEDGRSPSSSHNSWPANLVDS